MNTVQHISNHFCYFGPLPASTPSITRDQYQKWIGGQWGRDEQAELAAQLSEAKSKKSQIMQEANACVAPLQDAVDPGTATDKEMPALLA